VIGREFAVSRSRQNVGRTVLAGSYGIPAARAGGLDVAFSPVERRADALVSDLGPPC